MGIAFYFPTQVSPTLSWVPPHQPLVSVSMPVDFPAQIAGETAGGILYVQDKGSRRETFELRFDRLTQAERDIALNFFDTVKKAFSSFEYLDSAGIIHAVRWVSEFDFKPVVQGRFSGAVRLLALGKTS